IFDTVGGFSSDLRYREDHYFLMNVANISKIICDKKCSTIRRERSNSLSSVIDIISELSKHRPFWEKCNHYYPYLNVQRAEIHLLKKLYLFYLRNNRRTDILKIIQVTKPISKVNYILFSTFKNCPKLIDLIYKLRNKIKNVSI
ncbi:glycosyltransferase family 2 protein, partial [Providencia rettgeri]|nr:glycosyltransferase family 2 protein [Providencia rettgeri]